VASGVAILLVVFFLLVGVLFVGFLVFLVVAGVRNKRALEAGGLDPLAAEAQLAARAANSGLLAPRRSLEERLGELDDLRARGVISAEELATARAKALAEG
jgi:hypothetical protein